VARLTKYAIAAIEESLERGMMCEVIPTPSGVVIHHHPDRSDIDLPFPILVKNKKGIPVSLRLSMVDCDKQRTELIDIVVSPEDYWVLGIKGNNGPKR